MQELMRLCRQYLPQTLVGEQSFEEHLAVARQLPPYFSDDFGHEIYLDRPDDRAGISFMVRPGTSGWDFLCGRKEGTGRQLFEKPAWQRVRDFCLAAEHPSDWPETALRHIWFEFDIDADQMIIPDIFISLKRSQATPAVVENMIGFTAAQFGDLNFLNNVPALAPCLKSVHEGGLLNFGLMLARTFNGVRLEIFFPEGMESLYAYLENIPWPGSLTDLKKQVSWLDPVQANTILQIDLGQSVLPKMSIYLNLGEEKAAVFDMLAWGKIISSFEGQGLILPAKKEALLGFPGGTRELLGVDFVLLRGLSHLKIIFDGGDFLRAKGYFGFSCKEPFRVDN